MKRLTAILMASVLMLTVLAACAKTSGTSPTPSASPSPSVSDSAEPSESTPLPEINRNGIEFDEATDAFFGAYDDTNAALDAMTPLLYAALWGALDELEDDELFYAGNESPQASFMWTTVYNILNTSEFPAPSGGITQENGNIHVTRSAMTEVFISAFASDNIPEIAGTVADLISYDATSEAYTILAADTAGIAFVLKGIELSKASSAADPTMSATVLFDIVECSGTHLKVIAVELVPLSFSAYWYRIQAAYTVEAADLSVPGASPVTAQEISDILGFTPDLPDGAQDTVYTTRETGFGGSIVQIDFKLDGADIVYRIQATVAFSDISGVHETWTTNESVTVGYTDGEVHTTSSGKGICLWYDTTPGLMYSLYMSAGASVESLGALAQQLFVPLQGNV